MVDDKMAVVEAQEFDNFDEISDVFSDIWEIDADDFYDDSVEYPDEMLENFYIGIEDYPEDLDAWDYFDYWDDFWDAYFEDDYDDWYGYDDGDYSYPDGYDDDGAVG